MKNFFLLSCIMAGSICSFAQTGNYSAGTNAGNAVSTWSYNTAVGVSAGDVIVSSNGSYFGFEAGGLVTTGTGSFFGYQSGKANTGTGNSFFGYKSGPVNTGSNNLFAGHEAGVVNTSGASSVFLGYRAGYSTTTGGTNTFIGYRAGYTNISGAGNIFIGANAGYNETGSNKLYIENSTGTPLIYGDFSSNSVGINTSTPGSYTLNVNGTVNASDLHIAGAPYRASQWTTASSNISYATGGVSVGTTTLPTGYMFAVAGKAIAEEIVVQVQTSWPDYVFETNYKLKSIEELNLYINQHKHLPGVPSARVIEESGVSVGEMNAVMMEKIEELTLYIIELKKEIDALKQEKN